MSLRPTPQPTPQSLKLAETLRPAVPPKPHQPRAQPKPAQPKPAQPKPAQPKPAQPKAAQPIPAPKSFRRRDPYVQKTPEGQRFRYGLGTTQSGGLYKNLHRLRPEVLRFTQDPANPMRELFVALTADANQSRPKYLEKAKAYGLEPRLAEVLRFGIKLGGLQPGARLVNDLLADYARDMGLEGGIEHPRIRDFREALMAAHAQTNPNDAVEVLGERLGLVFAHTPQEVQAQYRRLLNLDEDFLEEVEDAQEEQLAERPSPGESETQTLELPGVVPQAIRLDQATRIETEALFLEVSGDLARIESLSQEQRRNILRLIQSRWREEAFRELTPDERAVFDALVTSVPDDPLYEAAQAPRLEMLNDLIEGNPAIIEIGQNWDQWLADYRATGETRPIEEALHYIVNLVGQVYGFEAPSVVVTGPPPVGSNVMGNFRVDSEGEITISVFLDRFDDDGSSSDFVWIGFEEAFHYFQWLQYSALRRNEALFDDAMQDRVEDWYLNAGLAQLNDVNISDDALDVYETQILEADAKEVAFLVASYFRQALGLAEHFPPPTDPMAR